MGRCEAVCGGDEELGLRGGKGTVHQEGQETVGPVLVCYDLILIYSKDNFIFNPRVTENVSMFIVQRRS